MLLTVFGVLVGIHHAFARKRSPVTELDPSRQVQSNRVPSHSALVPMGESGRSCRAGLGYDPPREGLGSRRSRPVRDRPLLVGTAAGAAASPCPNPCAVVVTVVEDVGAPAVPGRAEREPVRVVCGDEIPDLPGVGLVARDVVARRYRELGAIRRLPQAPPLLAYRPELETPLILVGVARKVHTPQLIVHVVLKLVGLGGNSFLLRGVTPPDRVERTAVHGRVELDAIRIVCAGRLGGEGDRVRRFLPCEPEDAPECCEDGHQKAGRPKAEPA